MYCRSVACTESISLYVQLLGLAYSGVIKYVKILLLMKLAA